MHARHVHQRLSCGRSIQSLDAKCNLPGALTCTAGLLLMIPTRRCRTCGKLLQVSPLVFLARAPEIPCKKCGTRTQLSILVNLFATALGFALAAVGVTTYFKAAQPSSGAPMGILPFVVTIALGIGIIMLTQIFVSSACYLIHSLLRSEDH